MPKPKLIVIDDSLTVCAVVRMLLEGASWEVETYQDPLVAIKALWESSAPLPTAVLLDIQLPHMDGYEVTKAIRTRAPEALRCVPIIGFSGKSGVLDRMKGGLVGMNDYLAKPFQAADLLRLVRSFAS